MIKLIVPNKTYLPSYQEAYCEYVANHIDTYHFTDAASCDVLAKFNDYRHERHLRADRVGADYYWLVDEHSTLFLGEVTIRHRLNDTLQQVGGHIGYGIRHSQWNRGYGTLLVALALDKAKELGLPAVLVTCNDDNPASARVLEKNGFVWQDTITLPLDGQTARIRRYWKTLL